MIYRMIGGPYKTPTVEETDEYDQENPPGSFDIFDDNPKYPIPIFAFSYVWLRSERLPDGKLCYVYQFAGRCDNLKVKRMELSTRDN